MHLAQILLLEGKSLPEHLFLDVMVRCDGEHNPLPVTTREKSISTGN